MVRSKSKRYHDRVVLASEKKHVASDCAARGASANRSALSPDKKRIVRDGGSGRGRKPRPYFAKPSDVSKNHDQETHGDVVLSGKDLQITEELATLGASANHSARCPEKKTAVDNDYSHRECKPWQPFKLRYACNPYPCPITYVLRGFECPFLDMRRISFVEPLPTTRVCVICWALPAMIMPLPCCHAVCFVCRYDAYAEHPQRHDKDHRALTMFRSGVCPKDGIPFGDPHLEVVTSVKAVYSSLVFCVNAVFGCRSKIELGHLKTHYLHECLFNPFTCPRCGRDDIPASKIAQHSLHCAGGSPVHQTDDEERNGYCSYKLFPRHSTLL
ncbi:hypothetical protein HPB49_021388 [Dermacentor silvarum]|uniref:Uncharacterized protein n=1 Tax=Dermacentor silvarum TaxID=543639 RepID=A0ACB8DRB3_DERSI|nr:hypothetical protein HPB49_021388 [Dermacentor silvarum]